jgi:hypothetical protein
VWEHIGGMKNVSMIKGRYTLKGIIPEEKRS